MLVKVNGREIGINAKEYFLLLFLLENKNAVLTRRAILGFKLDVGIDVGRFVATIKLK